jgi:monoamine oxidase
VKRRDFIANAGSAAFGAATVQFAAFGVSGARGRERIAIVGAGIAGLTTALRLRDAGISAILYDSASRVGGRMHS